MNNQINKTLKDLGIKNQINTNIWLNYLNQFKHNYTSQAGEDGILKKIFEWIGEETKYCVEFGTKDGRWFSNTRQFIERGWDSLCLDKEPNVSSDFVKREFITPENVNDIFKKYNIPLYFDLLSIDIDGNDYWVWKAINYRPRVLIIEFNPLISANKAKTIKYQADFMWNKTNYYGASLLALKELSFKKGMKLIYNNGFNAIFVLNEYLNNEFDLELIYENKSGFPSDKLGRKWINV